MSATEVKLFGRWSYEDVMVSDLSLVDYIAVSKSAQSFLPHTAGRYQMRRFRKALCPIVERLCCSMMMHGRNNGKKLMAVRIVKHAFEIIHLLTDKNPIQIYVDAVKNGGPREDSTRVGSAGVVRRQAVDVSPLRRVNQAIYLICTGARNSSFRNIKSIAESLLQLVLYFLFLVLLFLLLFAVILFILILSSGCFAVNRRAVMQFESEVSA
ncbi:unnamed protein product [Polarella glacialis]|uniref:Small ribosomal subunit protein uS7 domain-containing protein n=1 Tax=Polarella glacialis TaxID=89957 RepID=A0A813GPG0_POLGL|nr:unnamed protein product [Polarella glacialis]